jgi:hypothetical protein
LNNSTEPAGCVESAADTVADNDTDVVDDGAGLTGLAVIAEMLVLTAAAGGAGKTCVQVPAVVSIEISLAQNGVV